MGRRCLKGGPDSRRAWMLRSGAVGRVPQRHAYGTATGGPQRAEPGLVYAQAPVACGRRGAGRQAGS